MVECMCTCVYVDHDLVLSLSIQLLQFVNPKVKFSSGGKMKPGVAIILKDLLCVLDQFGINHPEEPSIRKVLRQKKGVLTSVNQCFLLDGTSAEQITKINSRHYSCIIIPKEEVPQAFFDKLENGTLHCCVHETVSENDN